MGCCVSIPLACVGSCCGSFIGSACSGKASSSAAKSIYLTFVFLSSLIALFLRYGQLNFLNNLLSYAVNTECDETCLEIQAAYRVCAALFIFFLLMLLLASVSIAFHLGQWMLKTCVWIALMVSAFFVPENVIDVYIDISRAGGVCFLLLQIVVLITMAYEWNRRWTEEDENVWLIAVLVVSFILLIGSCITWGFFISWFGNNGCNENLLFILVTIVLCLLGVIISISDFAPHGALLTSAVVTSYSTFVLYGALAANPNSECSDFDMTNSKWSMIGLFIAAISLAYRSFSLSRNNLFNTDEKEIAVASSDNDQKNVGSSNQIIGPTAKTSEELSVDEVSDVKSSVVRFHFFMALAALYVTMVVSNWGTDLIERESPDYFSVSKTVMWVSILSGWVTLALYIWTLLAPRCLPDRDFGVDID